MICHHIQKIIQEQGWINPIILRDVDGPGTGNGAIMTMQARPKEGGRLTYLLGYKYPYKGNPEESGVNDIHVIKKIIHFALKAINKPIIVALGLLFIAPKWLVGGIREAIVDYFYSLIEWKIYLHLIKPEKYCPCARELYRVFTILIERKKDSAMKKILTLARDVFCMFIEMDSAYKFRFQDVMVEADKFAFYQNPGKEMDKLFQILLDREIDNKTTGGMGSKWKRLRKLIRLGIKFPLIKNLVKEFVRELDFEKLKPDEGDRYFNMLRTDYCFEGKSLETRIEERKIIEGDNWKNFEELANCFIKDRDNLKKIVDELSKKQMEEQSRR